MFNLKKYMSFIHKMLNNNGLIDKYPDKPLQVIKKKGVIVGIEARNFKIIFMDGGITYSESGDIVDSNYTVKAHSYHFNPDKDSDLHPYRIDYNGKEPPHANDYNADKIKYDKGWPDHLHYPQDIELNIDNFNLALAMRTALTYMQLKKYPLDNSYANIYNETNEKLRRQLV